MSGNKTTFTAYLEGKLIESLNNLREIQDGVKSIHQILNELESDFENEITIMYNKMFEIVYIKNQEEMELRTIYSNQVISRETTNIIIDLHGEMIVMKEVIKVLHGILYGNTLN